jgi:protein-disulfide isomerase
MSRITPRLAVLLVAALAGGACTRSDPTPAAQAAAVSHAAPAGGAQSAGLGGNFTDSTSAAADRGRIRGADTTKVWLIEISDFQCPFCKRWHDDTYRTIDREYVQTGKVRVAYINYPIPSIHANAQAASEAAMCASAQGRFWELHDSLFDTQERWTPMKDPMPLFDSLAVVAKVNPTAWRSCMSTHAAAPLIAADRERAEQAGVRSTPSFFIGNRGLVGAYPVDTFRVVLDAAIANAARAR